MEEPMISVIIPVYGTERFLDECVQSVVSQTWRNLEILLVDDGSPDRCPEICDRWARRDSRIRVIHKPNGGQASARNAGLDAASGDYIGFVDSDDWVSPDLYRTLLETMAITGKKIGFCGCWAVSRGGAKRPGREPETNGSLDAREMIRNMLRGSVGTAVWNKLYAAELWKDLRFPEGISHEDIPVQIPLYRMAGGAAWTGKRLYYYRSNAGSVTHTCHLRNYSDMLRALEMVAEQLNSDAEGDMELDFRRFAGERAWEAVALLDKGTAPVQIRNRKIRDEYLKIMGKNARCFLSDRGVSGKKKWMYLLTLTRLFSPLRKGLGLIKRGYGRRKKDNGGIPEIL